MKKILTLFVGIAIFIFLLFIVQLLERPDPPIFSVPSGFYDKPFDLSITSTTQNVTIHYTLDGSIPTIDSPIFSDDLRISDRSEDQNDISMIPNISFRFIEPEGSVFKITTIRARSINNITKSKSPIVTQSYLVDENIGNRYSLPIISLIVDPNDLFDAMTGIYVLGESSKVNAREDDNYHFWPANYHQRGKDWERPVFIQYFDVDGEIRISQNAGIRIHGGASRSFRQKSFRLYAERQYDDFDQVNYSAFPNLFDDHDMENSIEYQTLILRNSGTDFGSSFMRDVLIQSLVEHTFVETQAAKPVIVFLNGEYWGLYYLYERYDQGYFKNLYDIDPSNLIVLERTGNVKAGVKKDEEIYLELLNFVSTNDIKHNEVYSEIKEKIDIDNFLDYFITQIFIANQDWPFTNIDYWRVRVPTDDTGNTYGNDGRWRWLLFDTDHGFEDIEKNMMKYVANERLPTLLLRNLLKNPEFQVLFINRFADHLNTTFQTDRVLREIKQISSLLEPEMEEQIDRWHSSGGSKEQWMNNIRLLRTFADARPRIMFQHLIDFFDLEGTYTLKVDSDVEGGFVRINSIDILPSTPGIEADSIYQGVYFKDIPLMIRAIPIDGYEFSHWEGTNNDFITEALIELVPGGDFHLQPVFVPVD